MKKTIHLYGKHSLYEAILAQKQGKKVIEKVFLAPSAQADPKLTGALQSASLPFEKVTDAEIEHMVGKGSVHQSVCATLFEETLYTPYELFTKKMKESIGAGKQPTVVLLDNLEDPHNVGAIIRSAVAFGVDGILMPEYDQADITGTVIKASSGMVFKLPIVKIKNVNTTLGQLKEIGFWTYALTGDGDTILGETVFDTPVVVVIGKEGDGIPMQTLKTCDFRLSIPMNKDCESLNASNATAIALYEIGKSRNSTS
jgi:23S rRNA (guanosine2251-2'-O)-methyltransferase